MSTTSERPDPAPTVPAPDRFRQLAESSPVGIFETDERGALLFVNDQWRELARYTGPTPIPPGTLDDRIEPADLDRVRTTFAQAFAERRDFDITARIRQPDGPHLHVRFQGSPLIMADGHLRGFLGTVMDLTEVVHATVARDLSEARYRELVATAPVGQAVYDLQGTLLEVNPAWAELLGYRPDQVIGRQASEFVHPDHRDHVVGLAPKLVKGEVDHLLEERRLLHRDGSSVWVSSSITVERDADGRALLFHSLILDITERKRAEESLRDSEARYRDVVEALHDGILVYDQHGLQAINPAAERMLGHDLAGLADPATVEAMDPVGSDGLPLARDDRAPMVARRTGEPVIGQINGLLVAGQGRRWFSVNARPRFVDGDLAGAVVTLSDITERKAAEDGLRESEIRFRTLAESLPVGIFHADVHAAIDYANPRWLEITDVSADQVADPSTAEMIHPADRAAVWRELGEAFTAHRPYHVQYRIHTRDGSVRWLSARGSRTYDPESGDATGILGSIEDVTPLLEAQERNARLASIVESTSDLAGIVDWHSGLMLYLNRAGRELLGYVDRDITTVHHLELFTDQAARIVQDDLETTLRNGEVWSGELPMRAADGSTVMVWQTIAAERLPDGDIYQLSAVGRDVTERRRFEDELAWQATHDAHTRLPNRAMLIDHVELALARAERDGNLVALLFLDLDRFKQVNDTLGHEAGDDLLVQAAQRISAVLRPTDTVARLGGDEFVVLADEVDDEDEAMEIAQRVAKAIDHTPFVLHDQPIEVTASIGIALSRGGDAHPEALLRDADAAMYRAKDLGRNRLEIFDESMRRRVAHRNEMADQLASSIEDDEITVYYQPCVDLTTGEITGVEALARWNHPLRGILSPYEFITLAEDTGLIVGLGLVVLSKACHQAYRWLERFGPSSPVVHVNLSARQLTAMNLPTLVEGVLQGTRLPPSKLCLEITESVLMDDAAAVIDTLWALKAIGVSIAIDDFGTGYSSLSYLRRFPVDVLKVDQSFVAGLGPDPEDSAIVAAIVNLAATLELDAIAEGVETREQLERLRALGCRSAQGFWFSEPGPADAIEALLDRPFTI